MATTITVPLDAASMASVLADALGDQEARRLAGRLSELAKRLELFTTDCTGGRYP